MNFRMNDLAQEPQSGTLHTLTVEPSQAGTRLDRWLADRLPALSRSRLQALIDQGALSSQGSVVVESSRKVKAAEIFTLAVPVAVAAEPVAQDLSLVVVFEDADLIVIDKPVGLVVHPAPGNQDKTLVNALLHHCRGSLSGIGGVRRPGIVHRIDKDTSGLLVVAKNDRAHHRLAAQFAEHSIERAYLALCYGVPLPRHGTVEGNIGRHPTLRTKMAIVAGGGKSAVTHYRVLQPFGGFASLVECRLETGRTHQIRVHMTALGHPLVGDKLYGTGQSRRAGSPVDAKTLLSQFPRQALHARSLGFIHPTSGEALRFESELPNDISDLIKSLEVL
jgi:23S rRNA pseudouridine1911/1915/1917 synthase